MSADRPLRLTLEITEIVRDLMIAILHLKTIARRIAVCDRTLRQQLKRENDAFGGQEAGENAQSAVEKKVNAEDKIPVNGFALTAELFDEAIDGSDNSHKNVGLAKPYK